MNNQLTKHLQRRPDWWMEDPLAMFMEKAHANVVATFVNNEMSEVFRICNKLFLAIRDGENCESKEATFPYFIRTYSYWLAAVRSWGSEQVPEAYAMMRASIESALYGNYLTIHDANEQLKMTFVNRREANGQVKRDFKKHFELRNLLKSMDESNAALARSIYEASIDLGAHPNIFSAFQNYVLTEEGREQHYYLGAKPEMMDTAALHLGCTAIVGITTFDYLILGTDEAENDIRPSIRNLSQHLKEHCKDTNDSST